MTLTIDSTRQLHGRYANESAHEYANEYANETGVQQLTRRLSVPIRDSLGFINEFGPLALISSNQPVNSIQ